MKWHVNDLPDHVKRLMRPEDRKELGKAGWTNDEALARAEAKTERQLQQLIISLLRLRGIVPIRSRMDMATTNNKGLMDILFAVWTNHQQDSDRHVVACAWEVKLPGKELDPDQESMRKEMTAPPNGWSHRIIYSVDDALRELRAMGL